MPRESGSKFKRSGGWAENTSLRFLDGNGSWCDTEQKQAIIICEEVLSVRTWSETIEKKCTSTQLTIVEDIRERHKWHDVQAGHHQRVLRACEDSMGRRIKLASLSEHQADNKRKRPQYSSRGTEKNVVIRCRVVEETVVLSQRHVPRSGTE
jgi:hypothetical protein